MSVTNYTDLVSRANTLNNKVTTRCASLADAAIGANLRKNETTISKPSKSADNAQKVFAEAIRSLKAGNLTKARRLGRDVLKLQPNNVEIINFLSRIADQAKNFDEVVAYMGMAIALNPANAGSYNNRGIALRELGRSSEALADFETALALKPDSVETLYNRGTLLLKLERNEEALLSLSEALKLNPALVPGFHNLAIAHHRLKNNLIAIKYFKIALNLDPSYKYAVTQNAIGIAYHQILQMDDALYSYNEAIKNDPNFADALTNMAHVLCDLGRHEEALEYHERAISCDPTLASSHIALLNTILYAPSLSHDELFEKHRRFERLVAAPNYAAIEPHTNVKDPHRRLRIGYLSSDLRAHHPVARNVLPVLQNHDRTLYEVYCYSAVERPDAKTDEVRSYADGWTSVAGLNDREVADLIRHDEIDILVCLGGRFDTNRLLVCSYKPAPIQVSFHDCATSGLDVIDYLISDRTLIPRSTREKFSERPFCLPAFYVIEKIADLPPIKKRSGALVFGSFNNPKKITEPVLDLWARVVKQVPDSKLFLGYQGKFSVAATRERVYAAFERHGIDRDRIEFSLAGRPEAEHLEQYNGIDIALDPFPFCGSTTTFEALTMGVPVVAMRGDSLVSSQSAGILTSLGLTQLIAHSASDYIAIAVRLSSDVVERNVLRDGLREAVNRSGIFQHVRKSRQVERFYRAAWRRWCAGPADP